MRIGLKEDEKLLDKKKKPNNGKYISHTVGGLSLTVDRGRPQ